MKPANPGILAINGGSSSIKFALFEAGNRLRRILAGEIERIGMPAATLRMQGLTSADNFTHSVSAPDYTAAMGELIDGIEARSGARHLLLWVIASCMADRNIMRQNRSLRK